MHKTSLSRRAKGTIRSKKDATLQRAICLHSEGELELARALYFEVLNKNPDDPDALHLLGVSLSQAGNYEQAWEYIKRAAFLRPDQAIYHSNLGNVLRELGRIDQALHAYQTALSLKSDFPEAHNNLGNLYLGKSELDLALFHYTEAIKLKPDYAVAYSNLANALRNSKRFKEALDSVEKAIALDPRFSGAYNNRGNTLRDLGLFQEALNSFNEAIRLKPNYFEAYSNRGNVLKDLRRFDEAFESFSQCLAINPQYANAHHNRSNLYYELRRYEEALVESQHAIRIKPDFAGAMNSQGSALRELSRPNDALALYDRAIEIDPFYPFVIGNAAHCACATVNWQGLQHRVQRILEGLKDRASPSTPFPLLSLIDAPEVHMQCSLDYVQKKFLAACNQLSQGLMRQAKGCRIHVGYVSGDFHDHATSHLIAQMFEMHDKSRFELTAISLGPERNDAVRKRVSSAFDRFIDVRFQSDKAVAERCRELGIDIAIDLKGHTQDSRPGIFAERCAPIQVSYLGYPGTMGASFIDYIVADPIVIPPDDVQYYSEKVIWLPHSYQANDRKRMIASTVYQRQALGLPEKGFIFCCFNNSYKIQPETFDVWMRILQQVSGSVLWLLALHPVASENLRKEAIARGVDPNRLVFAQRMKLPEHLARHRVADLFIDTWPYNAHTTASDALWAGLPVLTLAGRSFASRVGASLLNAVGLPELVTHRVEDYESLAIVLANDPGRLAGIRHKLGLNRLREPLFDCARFTRHLESAYEQIVQRYRDGLAPDHLRVNEVHVTQNESTPSEPIPSVDERVSIHCEGNTLEAMLGLQTRIEVMDVGAALINETPFYRRWLERGIAHLHAFEGDQRQIDLIKQTYQTRASVHEAFLFDGTAQTVFVASQASGMTSLLRPRKEVLRFFNGFEAFGQVVEQRSIQTRRLDEIQGVPRIDFLKMDVQGAELTILKHGTRVLEDCVAIQLEVSYVPLYEGQPSFGDVDVWLRGKGFVPHCFVEIKRWSIAPTVRNNDIRVPFNQLLESDIVYIRDPLKVENWDAESVKKLILLAHEALGSVDLAVFLMRELERRDPSLAALQQQYLLLVNKR